MTPLIIVLILVTAFIPMQLVYALDNITILDYTGDITIIQFPNGTTQNLNVSEYSKCVADQTMPNIERYLTEGAEEDEILTGNELGIAEAMDSCIG